MNKLGLIKLGLIKQGLIRYEKACKPKPWAQPYFILGLKSDVIGGNRRSYEAQFVEVIS